MADDKAMAFSEEDFGRLAECLRRFLPHTKRSEIALTGGVAIEMHLAAARTLGHRDALADVDFVATRIDAVAATVTRHLLVSHFHLPQPGSPKFMVQLVDPATRLRVDVFPDLAGSIGRARRRIVARHRLLMLEPVCILAHKRLTLAKATQDAPVDEKHQRDALTLGRLCGQPVDPLNAVRLNREVYGKDVSVCSRCESSRHDAFPIAPKQQIFDILGYT